MGKHETCILSNFLPIILPIFFFIHIYVFEVVVSAAFLKTAFLNVVSYTYYISLHSLSLAGWNKFKYN